MKALILALSLGLLLVGAVLAQTDGRGGLDADDMGRHHREMHGDDLADHMRGMHGEDWEEHLEGCLGRMESDEDTD